MHNACRTTMGKWSLSQKSRISIHDSRFKSLLRLPRLLP